MFAVYYESLNTSLQCSLVILNYTFHCIVALTSVTVIDIYVAINATDTVR